MAASGNYGENKFNFAAQGHRQPGSTGKVMGADDRAAQRVDPDSDDLHLHPLDLNIPLRALEGADQPTCFLKGHL